MTRGAGESASSCTQGDGDRVRMTLLKATGMILFVGSLLAIEPSLIRMGTGLGAPPLGLAAWSNLVGAAFCLAVSGYRAGLPRFGLRHLPFFLAWTLVLGCLFKVWLVVVAREVDATTIALVVSTRAFMVFGLAALIAMERPSLRRLAGLSLGFAAVAGLLLAQGAGSGGTAPRWLAAALCLPGLLALHTLLMAVRPRDIDAFAATGIMLLVSGAMLSVLAPWAGPGHVPAEAMVKLGGIVLTVGVAAGLALALALDLVSRVGPVFASQMAYVQTLAGIVWGMLLLGEALPSLSWVALGLVLVGVRLVQPAKASSNPARAVAPSR